MKKVTLIGIDPGKDGAVAVLSNGTLSVYKIKNYQLNACRIFSEIPDDHTILGAIEKLHPVYRARASSTWSLAKGVGFWDGVFCGLGTLVEVRPVDWQRKVTSLIERPKFPKGTKKKTREKMMKLHRENLKKESIRAAKEAFPKLNIDHDGVGDAINILRWLIAEYNLAEDLASDLGDIPG